MTRTRYITLPALVAMALAPSTFSQYSVPWSTIDGGGATAPNASAGGSFEVAGTIGQPDASSFAAPISGGSYSLVGGFWPAAAPTCALPGDMDLNALRNGVDVQGFVNCLIGINGSNCTCADINGNGTVGPEDVPGFVSLLLGL